jgi:serine/threonine protein kinase
MDKVKLPDEGFKLKNPKEWSKEFVDFVNYCLNKDPDHRPTAEMALKANKKFLSKAKDSKYLAENLLKGIPTLQERVYLI